MDIELTEQEVNIVIAILDSATIPLPKAEECFTLYTKFKNAK